MAETRSPKLSPACGDALKLSLVQQLAVLAFTALLLDGGGLLRLTAMALAGYWAGVLLILCRRGSSPKDGDLAFLKWGFLPLVGIGMAIAVAKARWAIALLLLLLTVPVSDVRAGEADALSKTIGRVRKLTEVQTRAVGAGGSTSEFYLLSRDVLADGNVGDFAAMLKDPHPIVRAMGLYVLAHTGRGAGEIEALVTDAQAVALVETCVGSDTTVGDIALRLLHDPGFLDLHPREPMLDRSRLAGLSIRMLSQDHGNAPEVARDTVREAMRSDGWPYVVPRPGEVRDGMSALAFVKGIGRAGPSDDVRRLLIKCVEASEQPADVPLAAASALTRDPHPAAVDALRSNAASLDRLADSKPGEKFVGEAEARVVLSVLAGRDATVSPFGSPPEETQRSPRYRAVLQLNHPMLLEQHRLAGLDAASVAADPRRLFELLAQLDRLSAPWDTYSDARPRAERLAKAEWLTIKDHPPEDDGRPHPAATAKRIAEMLKLPEDLARPEPFED